MTTEAYIITLYSGPTAIGVTMVQKMSLIAYEIGRLREALGLGPHDRAEVARWQPHPILDKWTLAETFEWR